MRIQAAALAMVICTAGTALAGDGMNLKVMNDGPDNLIVTIVDRNAEPPQEVLGGALINGNASISVPITADASGRGHVSWTAITRDRDMRRCGHGDRRGINDGGTLHVSANGHCPAS